MEQEHASQTNLKTNQKTNPHKWIYDEDVIMRLCNHLGWMADEITDKLPNIEGKEKREQVTHKINILGVAQEVIRNLSQQQIHLARGIEKLKNEKSNNIR